MSALSSTQSLRVIVPLMAACSVAMSGEVGGVQGAGGELSPPLTGAPARPAHLEIQLGSVQVPMAILTWQDHSSDELGFTIEHWAESAGTWVLQAQWNVPHDSVSTTYSSFGGYQGKYRVRAFSLSGASGWSNWARVR
jgi:hypothetical protein